LSNVAAVNSSDGSTGPAGSSGVSRNQSKAASTTGAVVPPLRAKTPTRGLTMPARAAGRPAGVNDWPSAEASAVRFVPSLLIRR
jgi:hypothetical protein